MLYKKAFYLIFFLFTLSASDCVDGETDNKPGAKSIRTQALEQVKRWQQTLEDLPEYTVSPVVGAKNKKATDILVWSANWPKSRLQAHVNRFIELLQEATFLDDRSRPSKEYCKQHKVIARELFNSSWVRDKDEYGRCEHFPYNWFFNEDKSLKKYTLGSKKAEDLYQAFSIFTWSNILSELLEAEKYKCEVGKSMWDRFSGNNATALGGKLAFLRIYNKYEQYPKLFSDWISGFSTDTDLIEITSKRYALEKILINTMKVTSLASAIVVPICAYFMYEEFNRNGTKWSFGRWDNTALTNSPADLRGLVTEPTSHFMQELSEPTSLVLMAQYLIGNASMQFLKLTRTPNGDCGATVAAAHNATWPVIRANLQPRNTLCSFALNKNTGIFEGGCEEYNGEVICLKTKKPDEPICMFNGLNQAEKSYYEYDGGFLNAKNPGYVITNNTLPRNGNAFEGESVGATSSMVDLNKVPNNIELIFSGNCLNINTHVQ